MIKGDSSDYELLEQWTKDFDCDGFASVEIGVREGMGSKIMLDNLKNFYLHIGIDPYANLEYQHYDETGKYTCDYTDKMRDTMLNDFYKYRNAGKFTLYNNTDTKFMNDRAHQESKFAFVHFDGPHMTRDVITRYVFDDYPKYNMQLIRDVLKYYDFDILDQGQNKICLERKI